MNALLAVFLSLAFASGPGSKAVDEVRGELDRVFEGGLGAGPLRRELGPDWVKKLPLKPKRVVRAAPTLVDLHAHLFMDHGMGPLFDGNFDEPLRSDDWSDRFSSKANAATLDASTLGVVVVALYAHPVLAPSRWSSLRSQIAQARAFVAKHPEWVIALDPEQGRRAHRAGKGVLVLSIEGAAGLVDDEEGLREFVDEGGVRIVTFAHLTDDDLSGAAMMQGAKGALGNPEGWLGSRVDERGIRVNPAGLTEKGRRVAAKLIERRVWIDLAHATDAAQEELLPMMRRAGQPPLYTHTSLRRWRPAERGLSDEQLFRASQLGGIVGIVPSEEVLEGTPVPSRFCPCKGGCRGGVWALAAQLDAVSRVLGPERTFVGSDFNGAMQHLAPNACPTDTPLDGEKGWFHIGQTALAFSTLRKAGLGDLGKAEDFFDAWAKVYGGP